MAEKRKKQLNSFALIYIKCSCGVKRGKSIAPRACGISQDVGCKKKKKAREEKKKPTELRVTRDSPLFSRQARYTWANQILIKTKIKRKRDTRRAHDQFKLVQKGNIVYATMYYYIIKAFVQERACVCIQKTAHCSAGKFWIRNGRAKKLKIPLLYKSRFALCAHIYDSHTQSIIYTKLILTFIYKIVENVHKKKKNVFHRI